MVSSKAGAHSAKLSKAFIDGKPMDVEVVVTATLRFKLKGAIISSYSTTGQGPDATESWTLNFSSMEQNPGGGGG
jgi:type VI protein secretion system component Hcp